MNRPATIHPPAKPANKPCNLGGFVCKAGHAGSVGGSHEVEDEDKDSAVERVISYVV